MNELQVLQARAAKRQRLATTLSLAAVLALGAGLRFYNLAGQSLWNDEGTSVALAGRSLQQIALSAAADIHPPLYHYLLHYWLGLFGASDVAARSLSAVLGVGLLGLTCLLGWRLFDRSTGWVAALVAAISSYQVYYAQEARMYMLLAFLGAASVYLFYEGWLEPEPRRPEWAIAAWVVVTVLALYTHYLAVTLILAENAAWIVSLRPAMRRAEARRNRLLRLALAWVGAQVIVAALFVPWLRLTWDQLHRWPAVSQPFGLLSLLKQALPLFALGPAVPASSLPWLVAIVLALALLGLALPGRPGQHSAAGRLLALLYWLMPLAVLYYLSLSRPVYHPKFLVLATPGFTLLVARGVTLLFPGRGSPWGQPLVRLRLAASGCAGLLVIAASMPGLYNYYFDPRYARDDYRGIAQYIAAAGRPGDVVLINAPSQIETVERYYDGPLTLAPIPAERPPSRKRTVRRLEQLLKDTRRVFGVFWATDESDPERIVEGWLDEHAYKSLDAWYGNVRLVVYAVPFEEAGSELRHPLNVDLGGRVCLEGYTLASDQAVAGDILQLNLLWRATNVIQRRYKVFTHLLDGAGRLVGQRDSEPCGGSCPTDTWREGQQIVDRYGLPIPPGTPPGEYLIEVGMYNPDDGQRLPVVEEGKATRDHVILQSVRVVRPQAPPPLAAFDMQHRRLTRGDDIRLLGFSFGRLASYEEILRPGDVAELVLFWQAVRQPQDDQQVLLRIVDQGGQVRLERSAPPVEGRYPLRDWQPEEIVRDLLHLHLPGDLAPGRYRLLLGWQPASAPQAQPAVNELLTFVVQ